MKVEVNAGRKNSIFSSCAESTEDKKSEFQEIHGQEQMAQVEPVNLHIPNKASLDCSIQSRPADWDTNQVLDWLTSMNLFNVKDKFNSHRINGSELIAMTDKKLLEIGVEDVYQRKMVMTCLEELKSRQGAEEDSEGSSTESSDECTSDCSEHDLREQIFTTPVKCHKCGKHIVHGSNRIGFQCEACGLCLHTECTKGKIQPCNSEKLEARKKLHQQTHSNGLSFGTDLCKDVPQSKHRTVPDILYICTQEIERQLQSNPELNVLEAYKIQKSSEEVCALKGAFDKASDAYTVSVTDLDLSTLCGVVKKYLRELTNPLVPTEWYDDFITAAKQSGETQGVASLGVLVNGLPKYHNSTLHFLFNHFSRISENKMNREENVKLGLAQTFCHIILRPDWSEIMSLVDNTQHHVTILRRLFTLYDNNNTECDKATPAATAQQSSTDVHGAVSAIHPRSESLFYSSQYEERLLPLDQYPWYWGEVSREEVQEATCDVEEGSFLVRNGSSHATHGDFTLVLRKGGGNLLIKIHHRHGLYGFCADSCPFESVPSLVSYYQHNSLAEYNATLNLKLRRGIAKRCQYEAYKSSDPQLLLKQLKRNHTELRSLTRECDGLLEKQISMSHDIQLLHQAQESFKELSKIFEEQIDRYTQQRSRSDGQETNDVQRNADILRARLADINIGKDVLGHTIQEKTGDNSVLATDIHTIKPTLRSLSRKQDHIINALLSQGVTRHELRHILHVDPHHHSSRCEPLTEATLSSSHDIPHMHRSSWFVNCTRVQAIEKLQNCTTGTFLLRPGSNDNHPYTLSIAINGVVGHCKVLFQDGHYGFAAPFLLYDSLVELVLHYKDNTLAHHNPQLNTKLLYPVNCS